VARSAGSTPVIAPSRIAASVTVRPNGPAVSWLAAIGTIPNREMRPRVGFTPTTEFQLAGLRIEPEVSVPTATAHRPAATATAEPLLDPPGLKVSPYGFFTWPPREL
jgi:hypothetical protein